MSQTEKWTVYYDGLCQICSREIDHYRGQAGADLIRFVDITADGFDAGSEGVDPVRVHKVMHVKSPSGELHTEVDAFIAIWEQLPKYHFAARLARVGAIRSVMNIGYNVFAVVRPYLPRRSKESCEQSPYCETRAAK